MTGKKEILPVVIVADAATALAVEHGYGIDELITGQGKDGLVNDNDCELSPDNRRAFGVFTVTSIMASAPGSRRAALGAALTWSVRLRGGIVRFSLPRA